MYDVHVCKCVCNAHIHTYIPCVCFALQVALNYSKYYSKYYDTKDDSSYKYVAITLFVVCKLICTYIHTHVCMVWADGWPMNQ